MDMLTSSETKEICKMHKMGLDFECSNCNRVKCCYKCFISPHFGHVPVQISDNDDSYYSNEPSKEITLRKKLRLLKKSYKPSDCKSQVDNLCVRITEEVWAYRRKFLLKMGEKLDDFNSQLDQSQPGQEQQRIRSELETFISTLKSQIESIDVNEDENEEEDEDFGDVLNYVKQANENQLISELSYDQQQDTFQGVQMKNKKYKNLERNQGLSNMVCEQQQLSSIEDFSERKQTNEMCFEEEGEQLIEKQQLFKEQHDYIEEEVSEQMCPATPSTGLVELEEEEEFKQCDYTQNKNITTNQISYVKQPTNVTQKAKNLKQLFVMQSNGKSLSLLFECNQSILQMKIIIFQRTGVPPLEQKLFFNTKELLNTALLSSYDIPKDSSIKLYIRSNQQSLQCLAQQAIQQQQYAQNQSRQMHQCFPNIWQTSQYEQGQQLFQKQQQQQQTQARQLFF